MSYSSTIYQNPNTMYKPRVIGIEYPKDPQPFVFGENTGLFSGTRDFMDFIKSIQEVGFFQTVYGKPFSKVLGDFIKDLFHDIGVFILANGDLLFLLPAIGLMLVTFFVGKNRFTRWILPLWFAYFVSRVLLHIIV